jgi:RNA polymerase sigma-70 factor (ECF subfamily)
MDSKKKQFEKAYEEYARGILRHAYFKVKDKETAEDMVQETFFKAWRNIVDEEGEDIKNTKAFLYKILNNTIIDYYRTKKEVYSLEQSFEENENLAIEENTDEKRLDDEIDNLKLKKYLSEIKEEYREILIMKYMDDLSINEMSKITNRSPVNVRVTIHRALLSLKKRYEK